jgi:Cu/Zn superoxide dismutase
VFGQSVVGHITFEQQFYNGPAKISGTIKGLLPFETIGLFIVDNGRIWYLNLIGVYYYFDYYRCSLGGKHLNPYGKKHGASKSCWRHVGDLESVQADQNGHIIIFNQNRIRFRKFHSMGSSNANSWRTISDW